MIRVRNSVAGTVRLIAVLSLIHSSAVLAGPAEDYEEGAKHIAAGDLVAAMAPLQKAADGGNAQAQALLAGIHAQSDAPADAATYYRKAAEQGNADGEFGLGSALVTGEGVPKDVSEGRKFIVRAAEQGHQLAISALAAAYINGGLDIPEDARESAEAQRWIKAAADNNFVPAMKRIADAFRNGGLGLNADAKAAAEWDEKIRKVLGLKQGRRNKKEQRK